VVGEIWKGKGEVGRKLESGKLEHAVGAVRENSYIRTGGHLTTALLSTFKIEIWSVKDLCHKFVGMEFCPVYYQSRAMRTIPPSGAGDATKVT
jgi:hypothetical protein